MSLTQLKGKRECEKNILSAKQYHIWNIFSYILSYTKFDSGNVALQAHWPFSHLPFLTCPPGALSTPVPHLPISLLPPQLHLVRLVLTSPTITHSAHFASFLLIAHLNTFQSVWYILLHCCAFWWDLCCHFFIDHQGNLRSLLCLSHTMSIHLNISGSCSGARPAKHSSQQLQITKCNLYTRSVR